VEDGTLVKPFDIDLMPDRAFYLLTRRNARTRKELRAVCSWIEAEAAAFV
jgi:LysR family glycine cleavage system transcriptional activator